MGIVELGMKIVADKLAEKGKERWDERQGRKAEESLRKTLFAQELRGLKICDCDCPVWSHCPKAAPVDGAVAVDEG